MKGAWLVATLLAALVLGVAGGSAQEKIVLEIMWFNPDEGIENDLRILRAFEALNPGIEVRHRYAAWDVYPDQLVTLAAVGQLPDLFWIREDTPHDLATGGILMNLEPFMARDPDFDTENFLPGVLESARVNGVQYALHRDIWAPMLYYNVDHFEAAGIAAPQIGWSYDELLEISRRLTNPQANRFGMANIQTNQYSIILSFGGRFMNESQTEFTLDEDAALAALEYIHNFPWVYHAQPQPGDLADWFEPQWVRGDVSMLFWGPWAWSNYTESVEFEWDVLPPPSGPAGTAAQIDGLMLGISSKTEHPEEAWKLLKFLAYSEEAQTMLVRLGMGSPTVRYPQTLQAFYDSEFAPRSVHNYIEALNHARAGFPRLPRSVMQAIGDALNSIVDPGTHPIIALEEHLPRAEALLREAREQAAARP